MSNDGGEWFIRIRGRIKGPFDLEAMRGLKERGQLGRVHEVSQDCRTWSPAATILELFQQPPTRPAADDAAAGQAGQQVVETAAAQSDGADWFYVENGQRLGPVPLGGLQQLFAAGQLPADALVWRAGMADWLPAANVHEFGGVYAQAAGGGPSLLRRFRWVIAGTVALSLLLIVGAAAIFFDGSVVGDSRLISTVESADSPEIIGQAVGLVVTGWKYRGADRKTKEEDFVLGPVFNGPYEKSSTGGKSGYSRIKKDNKEVMSTKNRYWMETKGIASIYHPLTEELCVTQNGFGQLIYSLGGSGTCFMITSDGYAMTNKHVVESAYEYMQSESLLKEMRTMDKYKELLKPMVWVFFDGQQYEAEIAFVSDDYDAALLKIKGKTNSPYFALGSTITESVAPRGSKVYALGYPGAASVALTKKERNNRVVKEESGTLIRDKFAYNDFDYSQNDGSISRVGKREPGMTIQHNADINPGNSGGPLVNKDGLVYGINFISNTRASGIHFALAIDQLRKEIDQQIKSEVKPLWK